MRNTMVQNTQNLTPLMKQYFDVKQKHKDAIVFFRLGDFYEMFEEDAQIAASILNITLTSRNKIPMCGIPYHSSNNYIPKLLHAGHKIAVCEQLEKPSKSKKIVDRNVVRVITPGTVIEEHLLDEKDNNYLLCLFPILKKRAIALSVVDISTGEIRATLLSGTAIESKLSVEIAKYSPKEIIIPNFALNDKKFFKIIKSFGKYISVFNKEDIEKDFNIEFANINDNFVETTSKDVKPAISGILNYISNNYKDVVGTIKNVHLYETNYFVNLSQNTIEHLELVENLYTKSRKYSLLDVLDSTKTPMGSRLLKKWLLEPLMGISEIKDRQKFVEFFYDNFNLTNDFRTILGQINDIERIMGRINCNINVPRDLIALKNLLSLLPNIKPMMSKSDNFKDQNIKKFILDFINDLDDPVLGKIYNFIDVSISDNPPNNIKDGNVIKNGFDEKLDRLRLIKKNGKKILLDYEKEEKERTKIPTLKIKFNNIFGYFFEVTKMYKNAVPLDYGRVQTLSNCERFTNEKLKKYEVELLQADSEALELEQKLYSSIREKIKEKLELLQKVISTLSILDVYSNFAYIANINNYVKPDINSGYDIDIKNGRHPVVENIFKDIEFVPNDTEFIENKCHFYLITGPNMAGKSTYIRQVALIVLMAQIGSFVPAEEAKIGVVDKIFTRIGSGDKLVKGESTFLVEMKETVEIIKESTEKSLVILDEVGRGTSTFDGISLAWVIANELVQREWMNKFLNIKTKGPRTLFATHYLELIELAEIHKSVKNFHLSVDDRHGEVLFLYKIMKGNSSKSYGIHVAKIAGLPIPLIEKAKKKLKDEKTGKIDFETQAENWERNRDISKIRDDKVNANNKQHDLMQAKTNKEIYTAKLKELEYKKESGKLVEKQEVEFAMFKFCKNIRDNILTIPNRISAEFAAQMINYIKPLLIETCGNENAEKVIKKIKLKNFENVAYRVWEKESREVLENLDNGMKL
jgi:DNA mismatch repair protein MutS